VARISQGDRFSDEEMAHTNESASRRATEGQRMTGRISDLALSQISEAIRDNTSVTHILMNLQVQETTFRSALAAADTALQPSLAAFLQ